MLVHALTLQCPITIMTVRTSGPVLIQNDGSCLMTKQTEWSVRSSRTQISLGIHPVWSVFAVCLMGSWGPNVSSYVQWRLWSDWVDAQADLSLRWVHMPFCWFCHEAAQIWKKESGRKYISVPHTCRLQNEPHLVKPVHAVCEQQRPRSACTSALSDQHLCCSLPYIYSCYISNFNTLASLCS